MHARQRDDAASLIPPGASPAPMPGWPDADAADRRAIIDALRADHWLPGARVVKREGDHVTALGALDTTIGDVEVVVKQIPRRRAAVGLLQSVLRNTRAQRQCAGARLIADLGITVSTPVALLRARIDARPFEWLILRAIRGTDLVRRFADPRFPPHEQSRAAAAAGRLVRRLAEARLLNRDHKLSNQLLMSNGEIGLVDTVGIRRCGGAGTRDPDALAIRMLTSMMREAIGVRILPARTILWRCVRAATDDPVRAWQALEDAARTGGDMTPRVDPRH